MRKHNCGAQLLPEEWVTGVCPQCDGDTDVRVTPAPDDTEEVS